MSVQLFKGGRKPVSLKSVIFKIMLSPLSFLIFSPFLFQNGYTFHFSDFDVDEFKQGNPDAVKDCTDVKEKAFYLPYDEEVYEMKEDSLIIGKKCFMLKFKTRLYELWIYLYF